MANGDYPPPNLSLTSICLNNKKAWRGELGAGKLTENGFGFDQRLVLEGRLGIVVSLATQPGGEHFPKFPENRQNMAKIPNPSAQTDFPNEWGRGEVFSIWRIWPKPFLRTRISIGYLLISGVTRNFLILNEVVLYWVTEFSILPFGKDIP